MQEEMQEAAEAGYSYVGIMGGATSFGGSEVVVVMERQPDSPPQFEYRLLATSKTSTMQKELQEAATRDSHTAVKQSLTQRSAAKSPW